MIGSSKNTLCYKTEFNCNFLFPIRQWSETMTTQAILRVILGPDSSQRVIFSAGLPSTVAELQTEIKTQCEIMEPIMVTFFFVTILQDDSNAVRESLIKGICIYLNENPDLLVQEYMVSTMLADLWDFLTSENFVYLCLLCIIYKVCIRVTAWEKIIWVASPASAMPFKCN